MPAANAAGGVAGSRVAQGCPVAPCAAPGCLQGCCRAWRSRSGGPMWSQAAAQQPAAVACCGARQTQMPWAAGPACSLLSRSRALCALSRACPTPCTACSCLSSPSVAVLSRRCPLHRSPPCTPAPDQPAAAPACTMAPTCLRLTAPLAVALALLAGLAAAEGEWRTGRECWRWQGAGWKRRRAPAAAAAAAARERAARSQRQLVFGRGELPSLQPP